MEQSVIMDIEGAEFLIACKNSLALSLVEFKYIRTPSSLLLTVPLTLYCDARSWTKGLNPTPCTRPFICMQ